MASTLHNSTLGACKKGYSGKKLTVRKEEEINSGMLEVGECGSD